LIALKASKMEPTPLDELIDALAARMKDLPEESDEYSNIADQYVKLHKLRDESNSRKRVSPDVLVQAVGSLTGILAILAYEGAGQIIRTKALGFVMKLAR